MDSYVNHSSHTAQRHCLSDTTQSTLHISAHTAQHIAQGHTAHSTRTAHTVGCGCTVTAQSCIVSSHTPMHIWWIHTTQQPHSRHQSTAHWKRTHTAQHTAEVHLSTVTAHSTQHSHSTYSTVHNSTVTQHNTRQRKAHSTQCTSHM